MKLKIFLGIALAAGCLVSCSVEDNDSAASQIKEDYTREFIKQFGTINPNQDWSVIEQKSVSVDLPKPSHVKIYEKQGDVYRVAANYKDVTKQTITFDGCEGDNTPFLVDIDGAIYAAENGQTVAIGSASTKGATRASVIPDECAFIQRRSPMTISLASNDYKMKNFPKDGVDHEATGMVAYDYARNVLRKGTTMTLYPVYSNSPYKHVFGIYYYVNGERVLVPIYEDKTESDDLSFFASQNGDMAYPVEADAVDCWQYTHTVTPSSPDGNWNVTYNPTEGDIFKFKSCPYDITATTTLSFGYYVKIGEKIYYSEANLNDDGKKCFAVGTIMRSDGTDQNYNYLCFDDPDGDKDFNDLVFYTPIKLSPVIEDETEWTVACEDLGGSYDYDFNDIVFRVKHSAGSPTITITPVAAGGTLEARLYYKNQQISDEWHKHFGNGYESNVMINTGRVTEHTVKPISLVGIPTDWSMKKFTADPSAKDGDLSIVVRRADGQQCTVTCPSNGSAPQMLILPYDWQWPTEQTPITTAYPNFGTWGSNYKDATWVETKDGNSVVSGFSDSEIIETDALEVLVE